MEWLLYGANGYTGRLAAAECVRRGLRPVLAGRSAEAIRALADSLDLEHRVFDLEDRSAMLRGVDGMGVVLHCAGPFSATSAPMIEACLQAGAHYVDITGEIDVFAHAWRQDDRARAADVALCPGAGFDVVPTDCIAARLVAELPSAVRLTLAFEAGGGLSHGTARTSVERLGEGGCVRRNGELRTVPLAWKTREIPFAHARRTAVTIPWGDVFTAWVSTGVPDIEVYLSLPPERIRQLRRLAWLQPLLRQHWVRRLAARWVDRRVSGPDEAARRSSAVEVWGEVESADGRRVTATLSGPNGYELTVSACLGIVEHLLQNPVEGGYFTPSLLMGADYAERLPGVRIKVLPGA